MQEIRKITLSPTRFIIDTIPSGVGSVLLTDNAKRASVNLFNLPDPRELVELADEYVTYKSWFFNPKNGQILPIGALTPGDENLYYLYDAPVEWQEEFTEILITAEPEDNPEPMGKVLLIGYLTSETDRSLEEFQPFSPVLTHHKWWKVNLRGRTVEHTQPHRANSTPPCHHCPNWQRTCWQPLPPREKREGQLDFDLPTLIGMKTDESGNLQYLVHAIPGRLLRREQPDQGRTGYLHWQPYYGIEEHPGAMGYWLCYIDPRTNQIATPMGVTIPPT